MDYLVAGLILWCIFLHGWIWHLHRNMRDMCSAFLDHIEVTNQHLTMSKQLADSMKENFTGLINAMKARA